MHYWPSVLVALMVLSTSPIPASAQDFTAAPALTPASADAIKANCDAYLSRATAMRGALEARKSASGMKDLRAFDDVSATIAAADNDAGLFAEVAPDDARRNAGRACQARTKDADDALKLSRPIYDRLKAIDATRADASAQLVLKRTLAEFDRNGVSRDEVTRAKVTALKSRISELEIKFEANISDARKTVTADPADLDGLPADYIAAHKPGPDGKVVISTDYPDLGPAMSYARSEDLRKRLYFANMTRAYPANDAVLTEMFAKRDELAKLLGRADYATLALEDKMIGTPADARAFLDRIAVAAEPAARRDYQRMLTRYRRDYPAATTLPPWSVAFVQQQLRKEDYAVDPQLVRQYFAYDNVRDGMLQLTRDLFGVEIRPWKTPLWDASAESYEMLDKGRVIGRFYFDTHPRPGKYSHANVVPIRMGETGRVVPVAALVTNFPAGGHATGLMEHRDVETFLHEYGHLIHVMFSGNVPYEASSMSNVEWDFIEAPSQMLENWVWDYDTLKRFAVDKDGKTIPPELVARMNKARYFAEAYGDRRQLGLSNIALAFHSGPPPADLSAATIAADAKYALVPLPDGTHLQSAFGHLGSYSAFYYTYMWSKTISTDLFTRFERDGLRNGAVAADYRAKVLAPGGSKPAAALVEDFLGRPLSSDAYQARLAKGQ